MKIVLHIDDKERWKNVKSNLDNLIKAQHDKNLDLCVEVVANGNAVLNLKKDESVLSDVDIQRGFDLKPTFSISACHNSMNRFGLNEEDIHPFINIVPAGILEIAKREEEGYSYIKP